MGWLRSRPERGEPGTVLVDGAQVAVTIELHAPATVRGGAHGDQVEGRLAAEQPLPVGRALRLHRSDGTSALVVIVNDDGRFLTAGPFH